MPRFSIVVPFFNSEDYLAACLESVRAQPFEDWEALLVDDASTDGGAAIARQFCERDARFRLISLPENRGRHLARASAVPYITGELTLFVDSDDALETDALAPIDAAMRDSGADMLHFGTRVEARLATSPETAQVFQDLINSPEPSLRHLEILDAICVPGDRHQDWRITNRGFTSELVRLAFRSMPEVRVDFADDAYELFALACHAQLEVTRNDIVAYVYNMGTGLTSNASMSAAAYLDKAAQLSAGMDAITSYAEAMGDPRVTEDAAAMNDMLVESLCNEWADYVVAPDKHEAALGALKLLGSSRVSASLMRFARDGFYDDWAQGRDELDGEAQWACDTARQFFNPSDASRALLDTYDRHKWEALRLSADVERRAWARREQVRFEAEGSQPVRVLVSAHKPVAYFDCDALQMIQVGAALASERFPNMLHDDTGENDSEQNRMLCETTAQYWAWKHVDSEYVGFCHYRRYFSFVDERFPQNVWGEINEDRLTPEMQERYGLTTESIRAAVEGWDVLHAPIQSLEDMPGDFSTPLEHYADAPKLHVEDLELCARITKEMHPDYAEDVDSYLNGTVSCFCNMFIMRNELFQEYAAWLFPILDRCIDEIDFSHYSVEAVRTPGHLAERLFNIWLVHQKRVNPAIKAKELQVVRFEHTEPESRVHPLPEPAITGPIIPVVFAADNNYVPMVSTTLVSMLEHITPGNVYDVSILHRDISWENQHDMRQMVERYPDVHLRFINVADHIDRYDLTTNNAHISVETYYRFLIQDLLPFYDKVLYLDSDLIVQRDVAELFATDVSQMLLAATRDVDYLGNLNMKDGIRLAYSKDVLGMKDPYAYFQAGVLVLNTQAMRDFMPLSDWLEIASNDAFIYNDQDVLNACCEGNVVYLDSRWNVMTDCGHRIQNVFSFAPAMAFQDFLRSREDPYVVHYAGCEKPWNTANCDQAPLFWHYARMTPFYERLAHPVPESHDFSPIGAYDTLKNSHLLRGMLDATMPLGSKRRELAKAAAKRLAGR